jgi:hypothetical protein
MTQDSVARLSVALADRYLNGRSDAMVRQGRPGQLAEIIDMQDPKALLDRR